MKRSRICTGSRRVAPVPGLSSMRTPISVGPDEIVVGTELNCSHLRSMTSGVLTATATPVRKGRTVHVWAIELTDEDDRMICISRCTLQVLKAPPKQNP